MRRLFASVIAISVSAVPLTAQCVLCPAPGSNVATPNTGCRIGGAPGVALSGSLATPGLPWALRVANANPTSSLASVLVGGQLNPGVALGPIGVTVPGTPQTACTLDVTPFATLPISIANSAGSTALLAPLDTNLCGLNVFGQALVVDPSANALGIDISNLSQWSVGHGRLVYDVDFSSPPHAVNAVPLVGSTQVPSPTPSRINFGTPTVRSAVGALTNQPCELDSRDGRGDQLQFAVNSPSRVDRYCFSCRIQTLQIGSPGGEFTILFDAPSVRAIRFQANGTARFTVLGTTPPPPVSFAIGAVIDIDVYVDLTADEWIVWFNNAEVARSAFGNASSLRSIRVTTNVTPNPAPVRVVVDDIRIFEG